MVRFWRTAQKGCRSENNPRFYGVLQEERGSSCSSETHRLERCGFRKETNHGSWFLVLKQEVLFCCSRTAVLLFPAASFCCIFCCFEKKNHYKNRCFFSETNRVLLLCCLILLKRTVFWTILSETKRWAVLVVRSLGTTPLGLFREISEQQSGSSFQRKKQHLKKKNSSSRTALFASFKQENTVCVLPREAQLFKKTKVCVFEQLLVVSW